MACFCCSRLSEGPLYSAEVNNNGLFWSWQILKLWHNSFEPFSAAIHWLLVTRKNTDFRTWCLQPWQIEPIFKLFEGNTSTASENWWPIASSVWEEASYLAAMSKSTITHILIWPPFLSFLNSDVSGKVWPKPISTKQSGFTLKSR